MDIWDEPFCLALAAKWFLQAPSRRALCYNPECAALPHGPDSLGAPHATVDRPARPGCPSIPSWLARTAHPLERRGAPGIWHTTFAPGRLLRPLGRASPWPPA